MLLYIATDSVGRLSYPRKISDMLLQLAKIWSKVQTWSNWWDCWLVDQELQTLLSCSLLLLISTILFSKNICINYFGIYRCLAIEWVLLCYKVAKVFTLLHTS